MYKKKHGTLRLPNERPFRLLLLFFAVIIASLVVSLDAESTITSIESFAKLIIFYLLIYYTIDTRLKFDIFVGLFVLLILREAAMSFTDYYGGGAIYRMGIQRAVGRTSFGSGANSLAATLAIAMPFMIAYWKIFRHWVLRIGMAGGLFLLVLMTINTGSRGGLLAMLTVCACTIYYTRYRMVTLIVAVVLMTGGWFMLPDQYKTRYATLVSDDDANDISTGRVEIWENGIRMFVAHPILGVGMNAFLLANSSGDYGPPIELNPHSLIIQLIANVGLIGTVVWFAYLWSWFRLLFKSPLQRRGPPGEENLFVWLNAYKQAILASTAAMFVSGLTAHNLGRFNWYMYAALAVLMLRLFAREIERLRSQSELEVDGLTEVPATARKTLTT